MTQLNNVSLDFSNDCFFFPCFLITHYYIKSLAKSKCYFKLLFKFIKFSGDIQYAIYYIFSDLTIVTYLIQISSLMGNCILGKRSKNFYRGFNDRQIEYIREKFETLSQNGVLDKSKFMAAYCLNESICQAFLLEADFEQTKGVDEYQFLCFVSALCNLTVEQLGSKLFSICMGKKGKQSVMKEADLLSFTSICLKYNAYLQRKNISEADIKKANRNKFEKYDFDKNKTIDLSEFCKICLKDLDYKNWMYNMGLITKKQMELYDQIYDFVDSDIGEEVDKHLSQINPNVDRIKRGVEHRAQDDEFQVEDAVGEQSVLKVRPWRNQIKHLKVSDLKDSPLRINENPPSQLLQLDFVLGYRSFDCRNNLKFDSKDRIVYNQAALGIVMSERANRQKNESEYKQSFLNEHKDDITCLDILGDLVVSGQMGVKPMIIIWQTNVNQDSIKSKMIITKQLTSSIGTVCFSRSGNFIAATCNDDDHRVVIYNLKELQSADNNLISSLKGIVASGPLTKYLVFDVKFTIDQKLLVVATIKDILFVTFDKVINSSRGVFGNFTTSIALCLLPLTIGKKELMAAGMGNGSIYFWQKDQCVQAVVGHTGSVSALSRRNDGEGFISGDKSGKIIIWDGKFKRERQILLEKTNSVSNMIVSLCHGKSKQILVGTKGSSILVIKQGERPRTIMSGHNEGTLWAMALHQKQPYLFTGGQDQRLIKWDYKFTKTIIKQIKCQYKIRALDYNHQCKLVLVGFINGVVQIFGEELDKLQGMCYNKIKNPDQQTLNLVRFDYYGKYFVVCYSLPEFKIAIFGINGKQIKLISNIKCTQKIISLDLSISKENQSKFIRFNTSDYKFKIYDISKVDKALDAKDGININWDTHTVAFSFETKATIGDGVEQEDISSVCRTLRYKNVVLVGDKYGKIKLFNYPTIENKIFNKYQGHSNAVTAMSFSFDGQWMVSIGGEQKSILIWKYDDIQNKFRPPEQPLDQDSQDVVSDKVKASKNDEFDEFELQTAAGQRQLATSQYKGQIKNPTNFVPNPKGDNRVPTEDIKIYHAFGIRNKYLNDQVRNQCKFSAEGKHALFPTACLAIKMNIQSREQKIFLEHKQDIVSFAVDKRRQVMATGQMAEKNLVNPLKKILSIYIWDIENGKVLKRLDGFHTIAIVLLQFSPSGKLLFSCGNDEKNTFAVYDWRSGAVLYSGPVSRSKVNGISWKSQTQFITCGYDHVKFWQNGKGRQGEISGKPESMVSAVVSNNIYITGGANGNIYNWIGNTSSEPIKAHNGKVQTLTTKKFFLFSGGDDGQIKRWKKQQNGSVKIPDLYLDLRSITLPNDIKPNEEQFSVLSLDFFQEDGEQLLIATRGCSVIYSNKGKTRLVTQGHYKGELWGLATSSKSDIFLTSGDDKTVRMWDIKQRSQIKRTNFQTKIRGIDWSNDGQKIVVADTKAKVYLYDTDLNKQDQYEGAPFKNNKNNGDQGWVEQIKFSPNSQLVAYGSHGISKSMQFLKVNGKKLILVRAFQAGSSALLHIDWSKDSTIISYNTQAAELLFQSAISSSPISAKSVCNEEWATWTQKFGFPVQGIFQGVDFSDINTVCRDQAKSFLAVGYDDQTIRLFKYPCYIPKQVHKAYYGHSSHVTRIRFSPNYMVSTGGEDKTIIVWSIDRKMQTKQEQDDNLGLDDLDDDVDLPGKILDFRKKKPKITQFYEAEDEGDEFSAVKPWLGAIKEPTFEYPPQTQQAPKSSIQLQYVQGYRTKDCRQNLYFCDKDTLIFHAAAVLIYHDTSKNTQTLFTDHNDDILSIDFHKQSGGVLTGQLGPKPLVNYYKDKKLVHSFQAPVKKGVLAVSISPDGQRGVCSGMDEDHEVALLDLQKGRILQIVKGSKKVILKLGWISNNQFVSVGINHFKLWTVEGNKISGKEGKQRGNFVSLAIGKGLVLTGASSGTIYTWRGVDCKLAVTLPKQTTSQKHEDSSSTASVVDSICIQKDFIAAGTKDGFIFCLDHSFKQINVFVLSSMLSLFNLTSYSPAIRSLDFRQNSMLIGTFGSEIFQVETQSLAKQNPKIKNITNHLKCHFSPNNTWTNQVWGLTVYNYLIFTCSDDATVRCWSLQERKLLSSASLNTILGPTGEQQLALDKKTRDYVQSSKGRSVCATGNGKQIKFIIVGCKEGTVKIFNFQNKTYKMTLKVIFKHAKEWISEIKFGYNVLVIGSHDNSIYVYDYDEETEIFKRKYKPLSKHSSYITHIDISQDSCYLQSTCGAYQLLFWDLNSGKQITSGATMLRDQRWKNWTCNLGWPVQGIYPKCTDGTFIHSVARSNLSVFNTHWKDNPRTPFILAAGNNNGKVCLYNFPCTIKNSKFVQGKGHSSHITNVQWSFNDQYVLSVGGEDQCLMYWRVKKGK